jgi:hypothetical protein
MVTLLLLTSIDAPPERVFDLARSIDAHQQSAEGTQERAIAGVTQGLIGMGDVVTWEARHFGIKQRLTVRVTAFRATGAIPGRHGFRRFQEHETRS